MVILSGFVDTDLQARRAVEIASGVRGVQTVKNSLVVKG
jgi:hyperosmotically inducible protein